MERKSTSIFKNKDDVQSCNNYRGIKFISHTVKICKRHKKVAICKQQYGFMPRRSTTDAIYCYKNVDDKYRDGQ